MNHLQSERPSFDNDEPRSKRKFLFHFWRFFWLTFLVVSLAYAWHSFYVPPNDIAWAEDYATAQRQAARSGKPMVLYFTAKWCVPCRVMKRQVWADVQVMELVNAKFIPVAIDVGDPENAEIMSSYKIAGSPVTVVCESQGKVVDWRTGGISKPEFLELLDSPNFPNGEN